MHFQNSKLSFFTNTASFGHFHQVSMSFITWMNANEIRQLQADRDRLCFEAHKTNSDDSWKAFREVRNKIKPVINKTKRNFIKTALSSKRPKEVWKMIHRILHPNKKPLNADPNKLNDFFINTNERILGTKPTTPSDLLEFIDSLSEDTTSQLPFTLRLVSHREVLSEIDKLRSDTSTGIDDIPVKFVKLAKEHLASPLQYIIDNCITQSTFPEAWKVARISPIPKVDQPLCEADYRPVSILPALSKVFERLVLNQMIAYIEERALLGATMSGSRKGHSTTTVLLGIRDALIRASKKGEVTLMVYADYSKAFDKVLFRTVLTKMHGLGFSKSFLHWVSNYLTNRQQLVQVNDEKSSLLTVEFGVPQGSVLGPMFFNLYVADLQEKLQLPSYQYADDTAFYVHSKVCDLDSAVKEVNDAIV